MKKLNDEFREQQAAQRKYIQLLVKRVGELYERCSMLEALLALSRTDTYDDYPRIH